VFVIKTSASRSRSRSFFTPAAVVKSAVEAFIDVFARSSLAQIAATGALARNVD
jgi:hypothetical protein